MRVPSSVLSPIWLRLNRRLRPGIKEMIFGERCICRPSGARPRLTYSPFTSRTTTGAPSLMRLVTRSLVRCDFPVPLRPVTILSRPSRVERSDAMCGNRRVDPSSNVCFAGSVSVRKSGGKTSTCEWFLDGNHDTSLLSRPFSRAPRIFPTRSRVSLSSAICEEILNGSTSSPVSLPSDMPSRSRSSRMPGMLAYWMSMIWTISERSLILSVTSK